MRNISFFRLSTGVWLLVLACGLAQAQTSSFTYQGKLTDGGAPANGAYQVQFKLYDTAAINTGTQIGSTMSFDGGSGNPPAVQVTNGVFTVQLDFGAGAFPGANRFLEISVRHKSIESFTPLTPRQPITSNPYAIRSANAAAADVATNATQLGGVAANQYVVTTDPRMTDARNPLAGSSNYIRNSGTTLQMSASFAIDGTGTANIFGAGRQFNLFGTRILGSSNNNLFLGFGAGQNTLTVTPVDNVFVGTNAGFNNTLGGGNSFFGNRAGNANVAGGNNSFFGKEAGLGNDGDQNSFFGAEAGRGNQFGEANSFVGTFAGKVNRNGRNNSFVGRSAGETNIDGSTNSFFGQFAGSGNVDGHQNSFFGACAGCGNDTGSNNSLFGVLAKANSNLTNATAIGYRSHVTQSNSIVLGSINGTNGCIPSPTEFCDSTKVGIGTTAPVATLHVVGASSFPAIPPIAVIESTGDQMPLAFKIGTTEHARIRSDNAGNLVFATLNGGAKDIYFRAGDDSGTDMFIRSVDGYVGIGITPAHKLHVNGMVAGVGPYQNLSDLRYKRDIRPIGGALSKVLSLRGVTFDWRREQFPALDFAAGRSVGFVAQEVEQIVPEAVTRDAEGFRSVAYSHLTPVLVEAVKEQQAQIETLQKLIDAQQQQINSLKKLVCAKNPNTGICKN